MIMKKGVIASVLAGAVLLGGCSRWTPQEPEALSIGEDGSVTELVRETLDADYYNIEELQNMIHSEVAAYNAQHGEDTVKLEEFETEENGEVTMKMAYASAQDYARFNNTEFYYGSMINAQLAGYLFDVSYKKVEDGVVVGDLVSGSEVIREMDEQVLILRAPQEVHLPGKVLYTSANAEILAPDVVNATGEQEKEEQKGLVLPSNAVYYGEEETYEEQAAANRVYIIFEY